MKKRIFALCAIVMMLVLTLVVCAESDYYRLQDTAELLTASESEDVLAKLDEVSEKHNVDVVIVTVEEPEEGFTVEEDADDWYDFLGYGEDGVMLYISTEDGYVYMFTVGACEEIISEEELSVIFDEVFNYCLDDNFADGFSLFAELVDKEIVKDGSFGTEEPDAVVEETDIAVEEPDYTNEDEETVYETESVERLHDFADILSDGEEEELLASLDEVSEKYDVDVVILTVEELWMGYNAEDDATELYEYFGYADDGVMLYVSMEEGNREIYILTKGICIEALDDETLDDILDDVYDYFKDEKYASGCRAFIKGIEEPINIQRNGKPFDFVMNIIIALVIGFIAAFIATSYWKGQLKSVSFRTGAATYMKPESLNITSSRDFFLYSIVDRREKPQRTSGSSTHTSSSGQTYGGKGRKF